MALGKGKGKKRATEPVAPTVFELSSAPRSAQTSPAVSPTLPTQDDPLFPPPHASMPSLILTCPPEEPCAAAIEDSSDSDSMYGSVPDLMDTAPHYSMPSLTSTTERSVSTAPTSVDPEATESDPTESDDSDRRIPKRAPPNLNKPLPPPPPRASERAAAAIDGRPVSPTLSCTSEQEQVLDLADPRPNSEALAAASKVMIFSAEGTGIPFGALFDPAIAEQSHTRQLIIFVRHFYCPACSAYLKALTAGISWEEYQHKIPVSTSFAIICCGQPDLLTHYKQYTGCEWPMYADPTRTIAKMLGLNRNLKLLGKEPEYMPDGLHGASKQELKWIRRSLKDPGGIKKKDLLRGGNITQMGGEFLFEDGDVVWCHRMRNMLNHVEVRLLRVALGLDE